MTAAGVKLSFRSRPRHARPAYIPTLFFSSIAWLAALALIVFGVSDMFAGSINVVNTTVVAAAAVLVAYMVMFSRKFLDDFGKEYIFELTEKEARLKVSGQGLSRGVVASMPFSEVRFVEHYTPRDQVSLVFHGKNDRIVEVPIWTMTNDASPAVDFLKERGIKIERV